MSYAVIEWQGKRAVFHATTAEWRADDEAFKRLLDSSGVAHRFTCASRVYALQVAGAAARELGGRLIVFKPYPERELPPGVVE